MKCSMCGKEIKSENYGILNGKKICYQCCAEVDKQELNNLKVGEKTILYFDGEYIINFPSTLKIKPYRISRARHNLAGFVNYAWFEFNGKNFIGKQYGNFSQICHVRRIKK